MIPSNVVQFQGQGQVTADDLNTFMQGCSTAVQLRGFIGITNMQVSLLGIAAPNDGGGGLFYWQSGTGFIDDNFSVIVPTNYASGAWLRNSITISGQRDYLTAPLTLWTDGSNGNDHNSGLTALAPLKHLQTATDLVMKNYDLAGQPVTINCTGNYNTGVVMLGAPVGGTDQSISFVGSGAQLTPVSQNGFQAYGAGAGFNISGFFIRLTGSGYYSSITCSNGARVAVGTGLSFGATLQAHANVTSSGVILFNSPYTITGNGNTHWDADGTGAQIYAPNVAITITSNPAFGSFAYCAHDANILCFNSTFSGSCSATWGVNVQSNGVIDTAGLLNIPPTTLGQTTNVFKASGGQYL